jgi:hypothetical protein
VSVHNVSTLWTDFLKKGIFAACEPKVQGRKNKPPKAVILPTDRVFLPKNKRNLCLVTEN